ncbi:MAG TPA: hypothetical protein VLK27_04040 [Chthoniobacterales bacterium]|nr:hypothetical protein [Chthoniobacterales bacterium]
MKFLALAILLASLVSGVAEPLMPTAEGTTWNYVLVQEKLTDNLDLTAPNELQRISVTYRVGGRKKIDGKELQRLEIYRDDVLDSVDLISVEKDGIICPARIQADGKVLKLVPPQTMLATPLAKGKGWTFEGTVGDTKVKQHYEVADEEDIEVPAGNFHAWRIHCEQSSPTPATIDRWFVSGIGFVKVATVVKGESGIAAQRSWLNLKDLPKIAPPKNAPADSNKLTGDVTSEPQGALKTEFNENTAILYARWHGRNLHDHATIRVVFIAENVSGISENSQIDEMETTAPEANSGGTFALSRPEGGWTTGDYRIEFYLDDTLADTVKFKILK